jgi:transcriptional regulator with GAF, ATPase, and Fis domain
MARGATVERNGPIEAPSAGPVLASGAVTADQLAALPALTSPSPDEDPYLGTLEELTSLLLEGITFEEHLEQIVDLTARAIPTAAAVSVTTIDVHGAYRTAASTGAGADAVDARQYDLMSGPCIAALETGEEKLVEDVGNDGRWPEVTELAADLGFRSLLAVPLRAAGRTIGALNVFAAEGDVIGEPVRHLARRIAAPTATALANAAAYRRLDLLRGQLEEALETRGRIERAKGVLMSRERCDADTAFGMLRRTSQDANRKLHDVAGLVLEHHERGLDR